MIDCIIIICSTTSNHPPLQSSKGRLLHPPPPSVLHYTSYMEPRKAPTPKNKNFSSHPPVSPAPPNRRSDAALHVAFPPGSWCPTSCSTVAPLLDSSSLLSLLEWCVIAILSTLTELLMEGGRYHPSVMMVVVHCVSSLSISHPSSRPHWPVMGLLTPLMSMMRVRILCIPSHARRLYELVALGTSTFPARSPRYCRRFFL